MVSDAPPIEAALPAFLEFARGSVLVAHNAPFDVGFLRHFALLQGRGWPPFEVLDTAKLARRVITRDDAPNCKLSSLAKAFNSSTTPNHRALADARATVDVLHGLMERLGGLGVHTLEELQTFTSRVSPGPAPQAAPGRRAPPRPRRLPVPRRARAGALRRHVPGPPHPGPHLLHRVGDPVADGRDGGDRRARRRHHLRDPARGGGARAPADRRAQAEVQPTLTVPREGPLPQADPRDLAPVVAGAAGARRRRRLPRAVLLPQDRREVPGRAARDVPGPPVLRPPGSRAVPRAVRARGDGPLPLPLRRERRRRVVRRRRALAARHPAEQPRRRGRT